MAAELTVARPSVPVLSNLDGALAGDGYGSGDYWVRHVREAVRFGESVTAVTAAEPGVRFVEVEPGSR